MRGRSSEQRLSVKHIYYIYIYIYLELVAQVRQVVGGSLIRLNKRNSTITLTPTDNSKDPKEPLWSWH